MLFVVISDVCRAVMVVSGLIELVAAVDQLVEPYSSLSDVPPSEELVGNFERSVFFVMEIVRDDDVVTLPLWRFW